MERAKNVGIIHGGGDAPGLNAVTFAIVMAARNEGLGVFGVKNGYEGTLLADGITELAESDVQDIHDKGGSTLGTTNRGVNFASKIGNGEIKRLDPQIIERVRSRVEELNINSLIVLGGDGTLTTALQLYESGIPVIGVPKTIDNDLMATDRTFGFSTAVDNTSASIERISDTIISMGRVGFIETYGRDTGHIALASGIAAQAHGILIPEIPYDLEVIIQNINRNIASRKKGVLVVVAEGAVPGNGSKSFLTQSRISENRLGGTARRIAGEIEDQVPGRFDISVDVLGHQVRGGRPNPDDRILARRFGDRAVQAVLRGEIGRMVSLRGDIVTTVPLSEAVNGIRLVDPGSDVVRMARRQGIFFGDV